MPDLPASLAAAFLPRYRIERELGVGGMATVGVLGYLLDRILGTGTVFTAIGFVLGAASGIYIVYLRYGKGGE